ncbi:hypothetical protein CF319_g9507, partial [Tilletia indica]
TSIPATSCPPGRTTSSASCTRRASSNASGVWPVCLRPSYLGNADEGVDKIATICGWAEELEQLIEAHHQKLKTEHATLPQKQVAKKDASNPAKETVQDVAAQVGKVVEEEAHSKKEQVADDADPPTEDAESLAAKLADLKVNSNDSK